MISAGAGGGLSGCCGEDSQHEASLREHSAMEKPPGDNRELQGHQPGGVEQERVQVFSVDGPMKRWL